MNKFLTIFTSLIVEHVYGELHNLSDALLLSFLYANKISNGFSFKALSLVVLVVIEIL